MPEPDSQKPPDGCLGIVFATAMATTFALYGLLPLFGIQVPRWVLWADMGVFTVLLVIAILVRTNSKAP